MGRSVKHVSKHLFGGMHRLEVAAAIARREPGEEFHVRLLAEEVGLPDNIVKEEVEHFVEAGILRRGRYRRKRRPSERTRPYRRSESPYWDGALDLYRSLSGDG